MAPRDACGESSLSGAEAIAAWLLSVAAVTVVAAYLVDRAGASFTPLVMGPIALAAGLALAIRLSRHATWRAVDVGAWALVVGSVVCWLIVVARPWGLPVGTGPDLTHHLLLIDYVERYWHLVHDPAVGPELGEMTHYTPGLHILAALLGAWSGRDGLHVVHALVSVSVAVKFGFVFLIARRALPRDMAGVPFAILAVLLLMLPRAYVFDSFLRESFLAQVVSEGFAVGMWWALTVWNDRPSLGAAALFALAGCGTFLTWPIWIGPPMAAFGLVWLGQRRIGFATRAAHAAAAILPIAVVAALYLAGRVEWLRMSSTGGEVLRPTVAVFHPAFLALSAAGMVAAMVIPSARTTAAFAVATALQAATLFVRAPDGDPAALYMTFKTFYLFPYPMAVAAAVGLALVWRRLVLAVSRSRDGRRLEIVSALAASLLIVVAGNRIVRPILADRRPAPPLSEPVYLAGRWARDHLPRRCVAYMVPDDDTAYWLHVAVLRNSRSADRTNDVATYSLGATVTRWYAPGGEPYAIADLTALGRDVRADLDVMAEFGTAAVVRKAGGICD